MIAPRDVGEVCDAVRAARRVIPVGGGTKPAMWLTQDVDVEPIDMTRLTGVTEYDPSELTVTAAAGTRVREVQSLLADRGQYLPFDPPLADAGATLAGVVAAGSSGPGAFAHGGVRDFIIGVRFVDGTGRLVAGGGKVVKNAAGFDFPKVLVGSMGRLGVILSLSFKVFPKPASSVTLAFKPATLEEAVALARRLARGPVQIDALDLSSEGTLLVRLAGQRTMLDARAERCARLAGIPARRLNAEGEAEHWRPAIELTWAPPGSDLVRVAVAPGQALALGQALAHSQVLVRFSLGMRLAWVAWPHDQPLAELDRLLQAQSLRGMRITGEAGPLLLGRDRSQPFAQRVRDGIDPHHRFVGF
jgi:glycolate dehydrogenase FAD-binding subunit